MFTKKNTVKAVHKTYSTNKSLKDKFTHITEIKKTKKLPTQINKSTVTWVHFTNGKTQVSLLTIFFGNTLYRRNKPRKTVLTLCSVDFPEWQELCFWMQMLFLNLFNQN